MVAERFVPAGSGLNDTAVAAFAASLSGGGEVIRPTDEAYDGARRVWNGMIDRRPALIVRCAETNGVVHAIAFARTNSLPIAVRGGGHSAPGYGTCDGGLVIDLSPMKTVTVDPIARVARAGAGALLGDLDRATQAHGLAVPAGMVSDTGIAGLTLGGGMGWLSRQFGLTIDNLLAVEIVTADGDVLRASEEEHPDLFWAIRGGSGNFGVVTTFELALHPVTQVLGGMLIYPFPMAGEVLRFYREIATSAPDELTIHAALVTGPDGRRAAAILACYSGDLEEGERVLAPIRAFGPPVADLIRPMKYSEMNTLIDEANPSGLLNYWKWNGLRELSDDVIDTAIEFFARVPSPRTVVTLDQLHGAARRISPTATAFAHRDAPYGLVLLSMWSDPDESERNIAWTRDLAAATEQYATGGVYVNGLAEDQARAVYGINYDRLVAVKNAYDPTNIFCHNQNIKPTVGATTKDGLQIRASLGVESA